MAVKINFNICDNSPECSGIAACDTGAIYWDENGTNMLGEKGVLSVDNRKCIACENCVGENGCPVGAIIFAPTDSALDAITATLNIDEDQIRNLFVDRYGAEPIDETICVSASGLEKAVAQKSGITVVECFADWSIQCLLSSIPIESIIKRVEMLCGIKDIRFYKVDISEEADESQTLPALHIYRDSKIIAKVEGYYTQQCENELMDLLEKLL